MNIEVPATSANLGPGFDSLGLSLKLYNKVTIRESKINSVSINGEGSDKVWLKKNNLFLNIFNDIFLELTGLRKNFRVIFDNKIPFSRGLGSSSAVIVSAVASAYQMAGFKVDKSIILNRSLQYESHPDNIAPAVHGGFVSAIVSGKEVMVSKTKIDDSIKAIVVVPDRPINTDESRSVLPKHYSLKDCVCNISHSSFLTSCFVKGDYHLLKDACKDMIHQERRMSCFAELFDVRKYAYENGSIMSCLSGSGSSFLNIVYRDDVERLHSKLCDKFPNFAVNIFSFDNDGFIISQS